MPKRRIDANALRFFAAAAVVVAAILLVTLLTQPQQGRGIVIPEGLDAPNAYSGIAWDERDHAYWAITDNGHGTNLIPVLRLVEFSVLDGNATILRSESITENGTIRTGFDLDPQDLAMAPDGTLWAVDSNHPWFLHLDRTGRIFEKIGITPWESHVPNRGPEGIAISPDGRFLYAILQNGLPGEPDPAHTEILRYEPRAQSFNTYAYWIGAPGDTSNSPTQAPKLSASGLIGLANDTLDVLEHGAHQARVYRVTLPNEPSKNPLEKTMVLDLVQAGYTPKKPEGITLEGDGNLAVINDADLAPLVNSELWTFPIPAKAPNVSHGLQ